MNLPKIHKREDIVNKATSVLRDCLLEQRKKLTDGEYLKVVATVLSDSIGSFAKYVIREERHPNDPDKPGGLE
jgi:hypothetical protein